MDYLSNEDFERIVENIKNKKHVERTPEQKLLDEFSIIYQTLSYAEKTGLRVMMRVMTEESRPLILEYLKNQMDFEKRNLETSNNHNYDASEFIVSLMKSGTPSLSNDFSTPPRPDYEDNENDDEEVLRNMRSFRNLMKKFNNQDVRDG